MKNLFDNEPSMFPFHYCTWDTSMFLEIAGPGDPRNVPHRALADISLVHSAVKETYDQLQEATYPHRRI